MLVDDDDIERIAAKLGVVVVKAQSHRPHFTPGRTKRAAYLSKWDRRAGSGPASVPHREQFAKDAARDAFRKKGAAR